MPLPSSFKKDPSGKFNQVEHDQVMHDHADEILTYDNVMKYGETENMLSNEFGAENFLVFTNNLNNINVNNGWKFHISVHFDDVKKAFDLIAPTLYREFFTFKVINVDNAFSFKTDDSQKQRLINGAQFTVYLRESDDEKADLSHLQVICEKLNQTLKDNDIRSGLPPESDAVMKGEYFSMRNESDYHGEYLS